MVNIRPLSATLAKKACEELNEKPNEIEQRIAELREWILKQPHLKSRTDDQFLVAFLRGSKYDMNLAKQKIDLFFTLRTLMPEVSENREMKYGKTAEIIKFGVSLPLPLTDGDDGPRIILIRPGRYDPSKYDIVEVMKYYLLVMDLLLLEDDNVIVGGQVGILDLTNVTKEHFMQFKPAFVKKMTLLGQDASPFRQKGFHYVNTPDGFEYLFNMFKSFMSEENRNMLYVHGYDLESLYRHVPRRFLPTEYGGEAGTVQSLTDEWERKLLENREWLLEWEQYGTNELLRIGPPVTEDTLVAGDGMVF